MPANAVETVSASSNADFKSLEEKILRTIELLKAAREAKPPPSAMPPACASSCMSAKRRSAPCARRWSACAGSAKRYVPE